MGYNSELDKKTKIERLEWLYEETLRVYKLGCDRGFNNYSLLENANELLKQIEEEII